jgi:hypothetical protein
MPASAARWRTDRRRNFLFSTAIIRTSGAASLTSRAAVRSTAKWSLPPSQKSYIRAVEGTVESIPVGAATPPATLVPPSPPGRALRAGSLLRSLLARALAINLPAITMRCAIWGEVITNRYQR